MSASVFYEPGTAFTLIDKYYCWDKPERGHTLRFCEELITFDKNDVLMVIASQINKEWTLVLSSSGVIDWMQGDLKYCTLRLFNKW